MYVIAPHLQLCGSDVGRFKLGNERPKLTAAKGPW